MNDPIINNKSFLLVDDEKEVRDSLLLFLKIHNYGEKSIHQAGNGIEALNVFSGLYHINRTPSVIISDLNMPQMDGLEFFKHLAENYESIFPNLIKIIITGSRIEYQEHAYNVCKSFGITVISKPFKLIEIMSVINNGK